MREMRSTHHYAFRPGEWAVIEAIEGWGYGSRSRDGRIRYVYRIRYADGFVDWCVVTDHVAGYEFR